MSPKWKYTDDARKRRYCEDCGKRLKKQEAVLCATCLAGLLTDAMPEIEEVGDAEPEEQDDETD
jgi:predicted amidophosphoribosyltransferase